MAIDRGAGSDDPWTSAWRRWHKLEAIGYDVVTIGDGVAGAVIASASSAFSQPGSSNEDRLPLPPGLSAMISAESAER
jgi:hypothetical protein